MPSLLGFLKTSQWTLTKRFRSQKLEYQIYWVALLVFLLGLIARWTSPPFNGMQQVLTPIALFGFAIGFSVWCWPSITNAWKHPIGKALITTLHIFILLLATVFSRFVVASALGLPPQDFELTVAFISIALYIPAGLFAASVLLGMFVIILEFFGLISLFVKRPKGELFAHFAGVVSLFLIVISLYGLAEKNLDRLYPLAKWIAFYADFQPASNYPGIASGERIRLHENGVISIAKVQNGELQIMIRKYEQ